MSVGKNKHYQLHGILPRHFLQTAERAGLAEGLADMAIDQIADKLPHAIETVCESLPVGFPVDIQDAIAKAALKRRERITAALKEAE